MSFGGWVALSALGVLGQLEVAPPDATPIRIELEAPPDCATAEAFYEAVRARTERARTVREGEVGVRVVVKLARIGPRTHGELRVIGDRGESDTRRVDGNTCTEVVEALSLTVALAVDPTALSNPPEHVEPPPPPEPPPPVPPPVEPAPPEPEYAVEVLLGLHVGVLGQVSPWVSQGGELSLRVVAPWESASSLGVAVLRYQNDLLAREPQASVQSTLIELTLCPKRFGDAKVFTIEPCFVGMGGWLGATGRGVQHSLAVIRSYFAAGGALIARAPFTPNWALELTAGVALPFARRRFVLMNPTRQIGETPNIAAFGSAGLTYSF